MLFDMAYVIKFKLQFVTGFTILLFMMIDGLPLLDVNKSLSYGLKESKNRFKGDTK